MQSLIDNLRSDLLDLLAQDARLWDLLHEGYQLLGNPLMVFNHRGEVLSISEHQPYNDPCWEEAERSCFYSKKRFSQITSYDFLENNPVLLTSKTSSFRIMAALLPNMVSKTYLVMLESQRLFTEPDQEVLMILASAISIKLRKRKRRDTLWIDTHELFISNLLQGMIKDEDTARDYALNFGIRIREGITIMTARSIMDLGESDILKFSTEIKNIFPECKTSIFKGDLIILVFDPVLTHRNSEAMAKAYKFFRENQMQVCVGITVRHFLSLIVQYRHTAATLNICSKLEIRDSIIYYDQYVIQNLLQSYETRELELMCHPGILNLYECDRQKGTCHVLTMYAYTITHGNHPDAAKMLNISSNTLKYRLNCIDKMLGSDWKKVLTFTLYLSVKILFILDPAFMKECESLERMSMDIRR
jgi:sugar diacid utilization regulator